MKKPSTSQIAKEYGLDKVLSVSEINKYIKDKLKDPHIFNVHVLGEVSNLFVHASGNTYFDIAEEESLLKCVVYRRYGGLDLKNGTLILARGSIATYESRSQYELVVDKVIPIGAGLLHAKVEQLKIKLRQEGLFDENRKKKVSRISTHVGLITANNSAACKDVLKAIYTRFPIDVSIISTSVQGANAPKEIITAIETFNRMKHIDSIILARGGGSMEDLMCFNDEKLARAIAKSKNPIVTGIGHQTDSTIADFVADKATHTPTAAGEYVVPDKLELLALVGELVIGLNRAKRSLRSKSEAYQRIRKYKLIGFALLLIILVLLIVLLI